jgi:hypothetical protein
LDVRRSFILRLSAVGRGAAGAAAGVVALGTFGVPTHISRFLLLVRVEAEKVDHSLFPGSLSERKKPPVGLTRGAVWEEQLEVSDET